MTVLTVDELLGMFKQEVAIIKHLHTKIAAGEEGFKPSEKQRTTLEVLRYLAHQGSSLVHMLEEKGPQNWETFESRVKDMTLSEFPAQMDRELSEITAYVSGLSEEGLNEVVSMWGMTMPVRVWLVGVVLRQFAVYRMQLFMNLKINGHSELNTSNLWMGQDGSM